MVARGGRAGERGASERPRVLSIHEAREQDATHVTLREP